MQYAKIPIEERETLLSFDYFDKKVILYSSRLATIKKLLKLLGEGKKNYDNDGKVTSMEWYIPFTLRNTIRKALSLSGLLPKK